MFMVNSGNTKKGDNYDQNNTLNINKEIEDNINSYLTYGSIAKGLIIFASIWPL